MRGLLPLSTDTRPLVCLFLVTLVVPMITVNAAGAVGCHKGYCQNGGVCSVTNSNKPICECPENHDTFFGGVHCEKEGTELVLPLNTIIAIACGIGGLLLIVLVATCSVCCFRLGNSEATTDDKDTAEKTGRSQDTAAIPMQTANGFAYVGPNGDDDDGEMMETAFGFDQNNRTNRRHNNKNNSNNHGVGDGGGALGPEEPSSTQFRGFIPPTPRTRPFESSAANSNRTPTRMNRPGSSSQLYIHDRGNTRTKQDGGYRNSISVVLPSDGYRDNFILQERRSDVGGDRRTGRTQSLLLNGERYGERVDMAYDYPATHDVYPGLRDQPTRTTHFPKARGFRYD